MPILSSYTVQSKTYYASYNISGDLHKSVTLANRHFPKPSKQAAKLLDQIANQKKITRIETYHKLIIKILGNRNLIPKALSSSGLQDKIPSKGLPRSRFKRPQRNGAIGWITYERNDINVSKSFHAGHSHLERLPNGQTLVDRRLGPG